MNNEQFENNATGNQATNFVKSKSALEYHISSNRSRALNTSRASNTGRGSHVIVLIEAGALNTSRALNISRGSWFTY